MGSSHQEEPWRAHRALSPCDVHANLLVRNFGRARVEFSTASSAVVMGEVCCVPLGRWQRTRRIAHASDECAIEERARIVFRICNAFVRGRNRNSVQPTEGPVTKCARSAAHRMWIAVRTYNSSSDRALVTDLISPDRTPRSRVRMFRWCWV